MRIGCAMELRWFRHQLSSLWRATKHSHIWSTFYVSFQELLHRTEQEDQARDRFYRMSSRSNRDPNRHSHGGSLQDLVEAVNSEHLLDGEFPLVGQSKRMNQHNSRHKKYSSVSSRQREGGSLPSNVNVSISYKEPFLNEFNKGDKAHTNERNVGANAGGLGSRQNSIGSGREESAVGETKRSHTVIEMHDDDVNETRHLIAHDSLAQVCVQFIQVHERWFSSVWADLIHLFVLLSAVAGHRWAHVQWRGHGTGRC